MNRHSTQLDRRSLLTGAAAAVGLTAIAGPLHAGPRSIVTTAPPPQPQPSATLATANASDWLAWIGSDFTAETEIGAVTLRLMSIDAMKADPNRPASLARSGGFFATFAHAVGVRPAGDRIYRLSSTRLLPMNVYFSVAADQLIAVFN